MPTLLPSFLRSLIPSSSNSNSNSQSQNENHPSSTPVSDQDSDIIPAGTVTVVQQQQQNPTINEPSNSQTQMEPITELSSMNMKPLALNAVTAAPRVVQEPESEPFPSIAAQPMEITPATAASAETEKQAEETTGVQRSKSKRLSKQNNVPGANKERSEAYNAFWSKLIGISPKAGGDKGKGSAERS